jgi:hypothetical protein
MSLLINDLTVFDLVWYDILSTVPFHQMAIDIFAEVSGRSKKDASATFVLIESVVSHPQVCSPKFLAQALSPKAMNALSVLGDEGAEVAELMNAHGRHVAIMKDGHYGVYTSRLALDKDILPRGKGQKPLTILEMILLIRQAQHIDDIKKEQVRAGIDEPVDILSISCNSPNEGFKQLRALGKELNKVISALSMSDPFEDTALDVAARREGEKALKRFLGRPSVHSFATRKPLFGLSRKGGTESTVPLHVETL